MAAAAAASKGGGMYNNNLLDKDPRVGIFAKQFNCVRSG